jgi:hypothetical protein
MKLEFSRNIFEKSSSVKFQENPSIANRIFLFGPTDREIDRLDVVNSHFPQFFELA